MNPSISLCPVPHRGKEVKSGMPTSSLIERSLCSVENRPGQLGRDRPQAVKPGLLCGSAWLGPANRAVLRRTSIRCASRRSATVFARVAAALPFKVMCSRTRTDKCGREAAEEKEEELRARAILCARASLVSFLTAAYSSFLLFTCVRI